MFWIALVVFGIPLIYMLAQHGQAKRNRERQLRRIEKRLAEKEAESDSTADSRRPLPKANQDDESLRHTK